MSCYSLYFSNFFFFFVNLAKEPVLLLLVTLSIDDDADAANTKMPLRALSPFKSLLQQHLSGFSFLFWDPVVSPFCVKINVKTNESCPYEYSYNLCLELQPYRHFVAGRQMKPNNDNIQVEAPLPKSDRRIT